MAKKKKSYPARVCSDCGNKARDKTNASGVKHCGRAMMSTWRNGKCGPDGKCFVAKEEK